jgi:hypothetical protein
MTRWLGAVSGAGMWRLERFICDAIGLRGCSTASLEKAFGPVAAIRRPAML